MKCDWKWILGQKLYILDMWGTKLNYSNSERKKYETLYIRDQITSFQKWRLKKCRKLKYEANLCAFPTHTQSLFVNFCTLLLRHTCQYGYVFAIRCGWCICCMGQCTIILNYCIQIYYIFYLYTLSFTTK